MNSYFVNCRLSKVKGIKSIKGLRLEQEKSVKLRYLKNHGLAVQRFSRTCFKLAQPSDNNPSQDGAELCQAHMVFLM